MPMSLSRYHKMSTDNGILRYLSRQQKESGHGNVTSTGQSHLKNISLPTNITRLDQLQIDKHTTYQFNGGVV